MDPHARPWPRAQATARQLHEALRQLGVPETVLVGLYVQADDAGAPLVRMPTLPLAAAERLLAAVATAAGPPWIGHRSSAQDLQPVPPEGRRQ